MNSSNQSKSPNHAAIIGGGVVGLMTARALHKRGHRPSVIDMAITPRQASWSAAGLLMHVPPWRQALIEPLSGQMLQYSWREYQQLQDELRSMDCDIDLGLDLGGACLDITGNRSQLDGWLKQNPQPAHTDSAHFPQFLKDHLSPKRDWVYLPNLGGQIRPPRLLEGLRTWLRHNGVVIHNLTVVSINPHAQGYEIHGYDEYGSRRSNADTVIVCAGAQSSNLYSDAGAPQVVPVAGHMIRYQLEEADGHKFVLGDSGGRYMVSRGDGVVLAGSNLREQRDFDVRVDEKVVTELHEFAASLLPILRDKPVAQAWVGLRPKHTQGEWPFIYRGASSGNGASRGNGASLGNSPSPTPSTGERPKHAVVAESDVLGDALANPDTAAATGIRSQSPMAGHISNSKNVGDTNTTPNNASVAVAVQAVSMASFRRRTECGEGATTLPDYQSPPPKPIYLHSGHFHSGIAFAPATAQVMASCIEDSGAGTDFSQETSIALEENLPSG